MLTMLPDTEKAGLFLAAQRGWERAKGVLLGVPLDDTSTFRPGTRFAPASLRMASRSLEEYSIYCQKDLRETAFWDAGDLVLATGNTGSSLKIISQAVSTLLDAGKKPFLMGGEHTITLGGVQGSLTAYKELSVLYFDAHADLRPSYQGVALSHASAAYHLQRLQGVKLYQFGIRSAEREELFYAPRGRFHLYAVAEPLKNMLPVLKNTPLYISLDMDVVDPAFAPGVASPEPGGILPQEILEVFSLLEDFKEQIIAFDLVEICPPYDPSQITLILGAKILREALLAFL